MVLGGYRQTIKPSLLQLKDCCRVEAMDAVLTKNYPAYKELFHFLVREVGVFKRRGRNFRHYILRNKSSWLTLPECTRNNFIVYLFRNNLGVGRLNFDNTNIHFPPLVMPHAQLYSREFFYCPEQVRYKILCSANPRLLGESGTLWKGELGMRRYNSPQAIFHNK